MAHDYQVAEISSDTIAHLLETFFTVSNLQQLPLLPPDDGLAWLLARDRPIALILALCVVSLPYSSSQIASNGIRTINCLDQFLSLCALASYEASHGHGAQAWCDIGTGQTMVSLISRSDLSPISRAVVGTAVDFLNWLRAEFAFGHPQLIASISPHIGALPNIDTTDPLDDQHANVNKATEILLRCVEYNSRDLSSDPTFPWERGSNFMSVRLHLEKFSIAVTETYHFDFGSAGSSISTTSKLAVGVSMPNPADRDGAPEMFLGGRVNACKASAESIHDLCTQLLSNQIFCLSPFLGFCCFQAAIVFVQSLEHSRTQSERVDHQDKLKVVLAVLLALRKLHRPARLWIDTLYKLIQVRNKPGKTPDLSHFKFPSFFSWFPGIQEPPLIPLQDPKEEEDIASRQDKVSSSKASTKPVEESSTAWMDQYRDELRNQIASIDIEDSRSTRTSSVLASSSQEIDDRGDSLHSDRSIPGDCENINAILPTPPTNNTLVPAGPISITPTQMSHINQPSGHSETLNFRGDEDSTNFAASILPNINNTTWSNFDSTLLVNDGNQLQTLAEEIEVPDIELPEWDLSSYLSLDNTILDLFHLT
ncbi:unnamed protein product [Clonostachys solani]|uniref:Transcription factor domain-containing protein n=1 Tax=Clonostachys solani TaxID=160281 RepID=A0A9P0EKZ2_9HYPO|nr:unnamed protein product [Clonostachys solani]